MVSVPRPPESSIHLPLPPSLGGSQWASLRLGYSTARVSTMIVLQAVLAGTTRPQASHRYIHRSRMRRDPRERRDRHELDDSGIVLCNPRDPQAPHPPPLEPIPTTPLRDL